MERRNFLLGLFALTAGSAAVAIAGKAEAAPAAASGGALPAVAPEAASGTALPDGTLIEKAQYYRGRHYRGRPRRRREVCRVTRNRFGRPVRVCRTVMY
jgi:hypothetical protein